MNIEFLNDLENKVSALLTILEEVRKENTDLKKNIGENDEAVASIKTENENLKAELELLKEEIANKEEKLQLTTEKIQGILARLEMVQ